MHKILGLAFRAKKILLGAENVVDAIRKNKVCLVFLAEDSAKNTKKLILDKSKYYNVDVIMKWHSNYLSQSIGKTNVKVIGIVDQGFCQLLNEKGSDLDG